MKIYELLNKEMELIKDFMKQDLNPNEKMYCQYRLKEIEDEIYALDKAWFYDEI